MLDWIENASADLAEMVNNAIGGPATWMEHWVWNFPSEAPLLAVILVATGLFVTVRLGLIQVRGFRHAIDITRGKYDNPDDDGDLNHFQALTTALSATVGIGNIAGVAVAIRYGGPGALFWMWLTAFFGMALKYAECTLALMHRRVNPDGSVSGGPMYYIELGMGKNWKWMAMLFAFFAVISSFGGGCMNQSNTLADQVHSQFDIPTVITGLVFAALVAMVIIGGIKRIGRVTSILAPGMALLYVAGALMILIVKIPEIPAAVALIFTQAFAPEPLVGGAAGSFMMTLMWGIRRGLFSNEAGQGSAPIAHAAAKTTEPAREGLVASLGPFIDTLVICTMTGLVIITTGAYKEKTEQELTLNDKFLEVVLAPSAADSDLIGLREARSESAIEVVDGLARGVSFFYWNSTIEDARVLDGDGKSWTGTLTADMDGKVRSSGEGGEAPRIVGTALITGSPMTAAAFRLGLGSLGTMIVTLAVILFAVSTGISWSYYGDRATEYLFGAWAIPYYRWMFILFFFLGSILPLSSVWTYGDVALGLMSLPNLIALLFLTGGVAKVTKDYMSREHKPYK